MKVVVILALGFLSTAWGQTLVEVLAQTGDYPNFPYCACPAAVPSAYRIKSAISRKGNRTFCFTVEVAPPAGCTDSCCTKADLKKLEINVKPECDVPGIALNATVNGVRSKVAPNFEPAPQGTPGATVLKLTQLGLNLTTANNSEICITLNTRGGRGCTTLEQACVPPLGGLPGVCSTALFSSENDCCKKGDVLGTVLPPPPPPTPMAEGNRECETCVTFSLESPGYIIPFNFTAAQCAAYAANVASNMAEKAAEVGANITERFARLSCGSRSVVVCGKFLSAAEGKKLLPYGNQLAADFLTLVTGDNTPPYLKGHIVTISIEGSDSLDSGEKCMTGIASISPITGALDFPKCICETRQGILPFAVFPFYTSRPGRRARTTLYCFTFGLVNALVSPNNTCAKATTLHKVEFWANETLRRYVNGFTVKPRAGNTTVIAASWSAKGDATIKATSLNWSLQQADGGEVCLDLDDDITLADFCLSDYNGCYLNVFDVSRKCCPLYASVDGPYVPPSP